MTKLPVDYSIMSDSNRLEIVNSFLARSFRKFMNRRTIFALMDIYGLGRKFFALTGTGCRTSRITIRFMWNGLASPPFLNTGSTLKRWIDPAKNGSGLAILS